MSARHGHRVASRHTTDDAPVTAIWGPGPDLSLAACKGATEPLWDDRLAGETDDQRDARHGRAKAYCARCPELMACLEARRDDSTLPPGVWGGCLVGRGPKRTNTHASPIRVLRRTA